MDSDRITPRREVAPLSNTREPLELTQRRAADVRYVEGDSLGQYQSATSPGLVDPSTASIPLSPHFEHPSSCSFMMAALQISL